MSIFLLSLVIFFLHWGNLSKDIKQFPSFAWHGLISGCKFLLSIMMLFFVLTKLYDYFEKRCPGTFFPCFCESSIQRAWNDLAFWLLLIAIGSTLCNYTPFVIEPNREWLFMLWKIVAIIMSMALGFLYYLNIYYKFRIIIRIDWLVYAKNKIEVTEMIVPGLLTVMCFFLLLASLASVIFLSNRCTLFFLIICTLIFIIVDHIINKYFEKAKQELLVQKCIIAAVNKKPVQADVIKEISGLGIFQNPANNIATLTDKGRYIYNYINDIKNVYSILDEVDYIINNFRNSLLYGNIPGMIGFCTLILVVLLDKQPNAVSGFIAGGTAMHMIFGNIVVAVGLREFKEQKNEFYKTG